MTDPTTEELNEQTFEQRAAMQSTEVPEGAVITDGFEWQTLRTILSDAGMTPEVGDWVFKDSEFAFGEATGEESDEPDPGLAATLRAWGHGPERVHAIVGALKAADLTVFVAEPREDQEA